MTALTSGSTPAHYTASEVLNRAADHIAQYGLMKRMGHGEGDIQTAPACALGAIGIGAREPELFAMAGDYVGAIDAMGTYLSPDAHGRRVVIPHWNDAPERTAEHVVEALRAAAVIEQAKESAPELTPAAVLVGSGA